MHIRNLLLFYRPFILKIMNQPKLFNYKVCKGFFLWLGMYLKGKNFLDTSYSKPFLLLIFFYNFFLF
ncbi:hypothetical protein CEJ87_15335 [Caldifermentibacillus hisashii]|nr:hypothetical protein CEJ87_15335 [Caldifermentibacillus hisashii]